MRDYLAEENRSRVARQRHLHASPFEVIELLAHEAWFLEWDLHPTRLAGALSIWFVGLVAVVAIMAAVASSLLPIGYQLGGNGGASQPSLSSSEVFLALAIGRIPGLSTDQAGIGLVGASLMVARIPCEMFIRIDTETVRDACHKVCSCVDGVCLLLLPLISACGERQHQRHTPGYGVAITG